MPGETQSSRTAKLEMPNNDREASLASGPLSTRARDLIVERIKFGTYLEGEKLPGETDLAKDLGVSRVTLREALKDLEFDGLIRRQHGIGTFVAEQIEKIEYKIEENLGAVEMVERAGHAVETTKTVIDDDFHASDIEAVFGGGNRRLVAIRRVRAVKSRPIVTVLDVLPWHPKVDYGQIARDNMTVFDFAEKVLGLSVGDGMAVLVPNRASKRVAEDLAITEGSLVMELEQIDYQRSGKPMLFSREWWSPSLVKFTAARRRPAVTNPRKKKRR